MWTEVNLKTQCWAKIDSYLKLHELTSWHYFLDEPWGPVALRLETESSAVTPPKCFFGEDLLSWTQDKFLEEKMEIPRYGKAWTPLKHLLHAASEFGLWLALNDERPDLLNPRKIIHCLLNTLGYCHKDEIHFTSEYFVRSKRRGYLNF